MKLRFPTVCRILSFSLLHVFPIVTAGTDGNRPCQVVYVESFVSDNETFSNISCQKTEERLSDFNRTHNVLIYECNSRPVYQYCGNTLYFAEYKSVDCALIPELFNICNVNSVNSFTSSENNQNPVLRNGTFSSKLHLTSITLARNGIQIIESGAFDCSYSIHFLDLSYNDIESLPTDVFNCLSLLIELRLNNNRIHRLSQGTFNDLISVRTFYLNSNRISHLPNMTFDGLRAIRWLNLESNKLESLSPSTFAYMRFLGILKLSRNNLQILTESYFPWLERLTELEFSMNPGLAMSNVTFAGLKDLVILRMDRCNLTSLPSGLFLNTPSLEQLYVQHNQLQEITSEIFRPLKNIIHLDVSFNELSILRDKPFELNTYLEVIYLSWNHLKEIKNEDFEGLSSLKYLNVSHNSLSKATFKNFYKLRNLEKLDISNNIGLKLEPFSLRTLKYFYARDCNMTSRFEMSRTFVGREMTEHIDLSGNKITEVACYNNLPQLRRLDLSQNKIKTISFYTYCYMDKLEFLNLSHNSLFKLPVPLFNGREMKYLRAIDVSHNTLTYIRWEDIQYAESVWAINNKVKELFMRDISATNIRTIHLEGNEIQRIHFDSDLTQILSNPIKKTGIYISENPVVCDCRAYRIFEDLKGKWRYPVYFADDLTCQLPPELKGRKVRSLNATDFTCEVLGSCPEECRCTYRAHDSATVVNCSWIGLHRLPVNVPSNTNVLLVGHNNLTSLGPLNESRFENLTVLKAQGNTISSEEFYVPMKLKELNVDGNRMMSLPDTIRRHAEKFKDFHITLSRNPWKCDCSALSLRSFLSAHAYQVRDASDVRCVFPNGSISSESLSSMAGLELCPANRTSQILWVRNAVIIALALLGTFVTGVSFKIYYTYSELIQVLIYTYCNPLYTLLCCHRHKNDEEKEYDCFVSYSSEDRDVTHAILEELGKDPSPEFKFCIHERHWHAGSLITDNIFRSVERSRKTLVLLSRTFLRSQWFQLEFNAAFVQTLKDRRNRIIVVLKGDLPDMKELPRDVQHVLTTRTYLKWGEKWFFQKLRYSLQEDGIPLRKMKRISFRRLTKHLRRRRSRTRDIALSPHRS